MKKESAPLLLIFMMLGFLTFSGLRFFSCVAATLVQNNITENTVWTAANSPYELGDEIEVNEGVTLTVEPGVNVTFDENAALIVEGSLIAVGNSTNRIAFTSDEPSPARGQWTGIRFVGGSEESLILKFVEVSYAENGIVVESLGNATIERSNVASNSLSGIHIVGQSNVVIKENSIELNGNGITTEGNTCSGIRIVGNVIFYNDDAGVFISSSNADFCHIFNVTIRNNFISENGNGIHLFSNAGTENDEAHIHEIQISGNVVIYNNYGIYLHTHAWYAGYIYDSTISNNTVFLNDDGINLCSASNWYSWICDVTISNNRVSAANDGISLDAFRTPEPPYKPVPFDTVIVNNTVSGCNNTGISVEGDVRANFTGNSVSYNSYGFYIISKDNVARQNDIYRNLLYGMYITHVGATEAQVDAEDNYWGDATGPFHASLNPGGAGDRVNGDGENLDFYPFLTAGLGYINNPPVAKLLVSKTDVPVNHTVAFDGLTSEDDSRVVSYFFDFGDGENSGWIDSPAIGHDYISPGVYSVSLRVMDEFGVKSDNTAVETVTVTLRPLTLYLFLDPMAVLPGGEVLIEVSVLDEIAVGVENVSVQLTSDGGGTLDPAFGYTDSYGDFNSDFHAPEVSESKIVRITATVSKARYEDDSTSAILSVIKPSSDGEDTDMSWVWFIATLAVIVVALIIFLKRRRRPRRSAKRS